MNIATEYRRRAKECQTLAQLAANDEHKKLIAGMSETWSILANQRERLMNQGQVDDPPRLLAWRAK